MNDPRPPDIPVAILAGGQGTRLYPLTEHQPKALVTLGSQPIVEHVMGHYASYGFARFVVALGHLGQQMRAHFQRRSCWQVELLDTGEHTGSGGRLRRLRSRLAAGTFMLTWCDGLSDIDLHALVRFHRDHGRLATVTAVHPPLRFGHLQLQGDRVEAFQEKSVLTDLWINGAFFVLEPGMLDFIDDDATMLERGPLQRLAAEGELIAYRHEGFWACMDTVADREHLERLLACGEAPWRSLTA